MAKKRTQADFPTSGEILEFLKSTDNNITKREISRAFGIKGPDKVQLKKLLRTMLESGVIIRDESKFLRPADQLKPVQVVEYDKTDDDGDVLVRPVNFPEGVTPPTIYLTPSKDPRKGAGFGPNDQALVRLFPLRDETSSYRAKVIKVLKVQETTQIMGVFHGDEQGGRVHPVDKKNRDDLLIDKKHVGKAKDGELVLAENLSPSKRGGRKMGLKPGRIKECLGDVSEARSISLIAIHAHGIPNEFPSEVLAAAENAEMVTLGKRTDMRHIPLITIDPADARDHDDAIWAEADTDPNNQGGWHTIVAIADVAHYVQPESPLDKEAYKRGNSCYFPDRVVPMLPEALSAGLCSLRPGEDRACMAVHMWFDKKGQKIKHKFVRGLMRSAANIEYKRVQAAIEGDVDDIATPILEPVLKPLYGAYASLCKARDKRQPLDLDLPEKKIELGPDGHVKSIVLRERLDAHRLVEEFMIAANVCAAEELENHKTPAMYRVHEEPSMDKMESLREFLSSIDLTITKGAVLKPLLFNGVLSQIKESPYEIMVNQVVLRSQMQAYYSPENQGHFGLALARYAHFTSPIRRYSDLMVHRGLVRALGLGDDGLTPDEMEKLTEIGEHISETERRAMTAERDSTDRYLAAYLSDQVGEEMSGRISGVTRFGLFVTLEPSGGDGLIPISDLGGDYFVHDEDHHELVGERTGHKFKIGDTLEVRLTEANRFTGGLRLELAGDSQLPGFITKGPRGSRSGSKGRGFKRRPQRANNSTGADSRPPSRSGGGKPRGGKPTRKKGRR